MASEAVLRELFQVAKASRVFRGKTEEELWKACQAYSNRSDEDIHIAMNNILKKDADTEKKIHEQKNKLIQGKEKIMKLHEQETDDRHQDEQRAEKILEELFNL